MWHLSGAADYAYGLVILMKHSGRQLKRRATIATMGVEVASAMRFVVRRYDSVPMVDQIHGSDQDLRVEPTSRYAGALATSQDAKSMAKLSNGAIGGGVTSMGYNSAQVLSDTANESASTDTLSMPNNDSADVDAEMNEVVNRGRVYAKRHRRRLVAKNGEVNIVKSRLSQKRRKFVLDIFTTILEIRWRFLLLLFAAGFLVTWFVFALLWWIVLIAHKDHLHKDDDDWQPCMGNVYDFPTALLFSIETQHTIGYGSRVMESKCPDAMLILMLQSCVGVFIQSLLTGLIFAKLSRPKKRAQTIMFSKNAVICQRDGEICLLFRLGDMRKSHIVGVTIRAVLVKNRLTKEGELIPLCSMPLKVEAETMLPDDNFVFLAWPVTVVHRINEDSPLWAMSLDQLLQEKFEIVVVLEGTIEATGMTAQLRTSYLPSEILWGYLLAPLVTYQKENGYYNIDYTQFHNTIPVLSMPECSARTLKEKRNNNSKHNNLNNVGQNSRPREPEYPVNFTAPAFRPPKRTWSFRARGSLKNSLRRKGSTSKQQQQQQNKTSGLATMHDIVGSSENALQKVGSPCTSTSCCSSLHSVMEQEPQQQQQQQKCNNSTPSIPTPDSSSKDSKDTQLNISHSTEKI